MTGLGFHQQCRTSTRLAPALFPSASFPVTQSQWPHPARLLYLVLHYLPASSLPWEGVNPVTVDVELPSGEEATPTLEEVALLCPYPLLLPEPWDGLKGRKERSKEPR